MCGQNLEVCRPFNYKYFPVLLFTMYKVALAFVFVEEFLMCDHSSESY